MNKGDLKQFLMDSTKANGYGCGLVDRRRGI